MIKLFMLVVARLFVVGLIRHSFERNAQGERLSGSDVLGLIAICVVGLCAAAPFLSGAVGTWGSNWFLAILLFLIGAVPLGFAWMALSALRGKPMTPEIERALNKFS